MTKQGWLTKQFDSARKDVEELPRWLQDESPATSETRGSNKNQVVHPHQANPAVPSLKKD